MLRRALLLIALLAASPALAADIGAAPADMVVLTVAGAIAKSNRGPVQPGKDSLFAHRDIKFERAFVFDPAMLKSLKQRTAAAQPAPLTKPATFTGPLVKDVLAAVGAERTRVSFMALDGYVSWLDADDIDGSDWILALDADGVPLGLGEQGPIWVLDSPVTGDSQEATQRAAAQQAHWNWSVFYMRVGE
jgi:hypothetical protein